MTYYLVAGGLALWVVGVCIVVSIMVGMYRVLTHWE